MVVPLVFAGADLLEVGDGHAALVGLREEMTVAAHLDREPFGESVHHADTHAVKTA